MPRPGSDVSRIPSALNLKSVCFRIEKTVNNIDIDEVYDNYAYAQCQLDTGLIGGSLHKLCGCLTTVLYT